jgi:hypothetical protein
LFFLSHQNSQTERNSCRPYSKSIGDKTRMSIKKKQHIAHNVGYVLFLTGGLRHIFFVLFNGSKRMLLIAVNQYVV